ncbi:hypothetical protein CRE_31258 [Caenorhabditis remanei]|uniref:NTF2-like domain-containing protein n=1 Tax=Caenorhabditis remanei TaxID=31234 RepID=E3MLG6_CAERE|nr:hypothetical protein CRE_31258 [Caenorhabditis remanei]
MEESIKTRNRATISDLFAPDFGFDLCDSHANKKEFAEILARLPTRLNVTFTLKKFTNYKSAIKFEVAESGNMNTNLGFYIKLQEKLTSGFIVNCEGIPPH